MPSISFFREVDTNNPREYLLQLREAVSGKLIQGRARTVRYRRRHSGDRLIAYHGKRMVRIWDLQPSLHELGRYLIGVDDIKEVTVQEDTIHFTGFDELQVLQPGLRVACDRAYIYRRRVNGAQLPVTLKTGCQL